MLRAGPRRPDAEASTSGEDVTQLYARLHEYLQLETKFQPRLCLSEEHEHGEVSTGARDGAAHVLRCLKVWFDLPAEVLIHAINLFDRFLTKMKVRSCHVPCITVSCMNIALEHYSAQTKTPLKVSVEELVSISQSACTARDVVRMSRVLVDKLSLASAECVTSLHWLRVFSQLLQRAVPSLQLQGDKGTLESLVTMLEITACDYKCANARTSELALVLLYHKLECELVEWSRKAESQLAPPVPEDAYRVFNYAADLQAICHMSDRSLVSTLEVVKSVLGRYEAAAAAPHRQRLVWRLSERTLKVLRPTDRLTSLLPTIEEQQHLAVDGTPTRNRSGSESSENEETSDWPRSPVLPVYCDN